MFIIYNLGILYIKHLQVHIYTHTHTVRVQLRLGFLCIDGLHFVTSWSALQMIPMVSFTVCKSMFSHVRSTAFSCADASPLP